MDWSNINTDRDTSGLGPIEYDQTKVPALIRKHADNVRGKSYGQQVREAQARNAEYAGLIASEAVGISNETNVRQNNLEDTFNSLQQEITDKDIISAPEIIAARKYKSKTFGTLSERIDYIQDGMVNVKNFGAKGDGVTDDTESVKAAIAHACTFAKGTGWKSYVPNIFFPSGDYVISEPQALNPTISALLGYNIVGEGYMNTRIKYTYEGNGENDYLMLNGGKSWWGFSYVEKISFSGNGNNNIWAIKSMAGSPQANRFNKVNFGNVKNCVTVLYGNMNANADLFRFESCKANNIYGWVFGVDSAQNSQSVAHSFVNCDFETIYGRILYFKSGGEVNAIGGSWIVNGNGRVIECFDTSGAGIGPQNNYFTFYSTKFEWQGSENRINDETAPLSLSNSYASLLFYRCNFGQFITATTEPYVFSRVHMGELIFEKCHIPNNMQVKLTKNGGTNLGYYTPSLLLDGCKVNRPLDQIAQIEITGGTTNNVQWDPIVRSINCTSTTLGAPIDVDLSGSANNKKGISKTKKIFRYGGLPNANKTMRLPIGSILTKIYIYVPKDGNGNTFNYTFKTSAGDVLHTVSFSPYNSTGAYVSNDLYHIINSELASNITIEVSTTSPVSAAGHIELEYM